MNLIEDFKSECPCGLKHETTIKDIRIDSGLVSSVGEILNSNGFPNRLLLVADKNTLKASKGIENSLDGFEVEYKIYDDIRVATMEHVEELEELVKNKEVAILSVGSGSVNDPCRLAAARQDKMLCIFATAPSMDGFASYSSPIVSNGFKESFPAKSPEVIIGDTKILANAPTVLKSAGFGDMIAKYIALVDWQISALLTDEIYCERVGKLTRDAVDKLMGMADRVTINDEETAGEIFKALLMTGIGMSFMQNSRPASGSEHIIAHLIECIELRDGIIPNFHGEDVGVCTLLMLKYYRDLAEKESITAQKENIDWGKIYDFYGEMADDVKRLNEPNTITDSVNASDIEKKWSQIKKIIDSIPSYEECLTAMKKAGCKLTIDDIEKSEKLVNDCIEYSPFMRRRLTLLRLKNMIRFFKFDI
jgi:glycerol-1-phosphate dehydrogenase [NAD(P)+]